MELGSYNIIRKIATGGMAEIFLARHQSAEGFQRQLVIKRILPEYTDDPSFVQSFLDEARLAGQLNHPNIVQIYDLGRLGKSYFIAMEYIRGVDLSTLLRFCRGIHTPLSLPVAVRIFCDVCSGLDYAHRAADIDGHELGVVHRDVTPSNVIVSFEGPAKVVDFGIAKATAKGDGKTKTGTIKGKFAYLAPEQVLGQAIDRRVDVFASGIMLYELLANRNPFRGETEYQSLQNIVSGKIPPLSSVRGDVPPALDAVITKALQREPEDRFASCAELMAATEAVVRDTGITYGYPQVHAYLRENEAALTEMNEKSVRDEVSDLSGESLSAGATVTGMDISPDAALRVVPRRHVVPYAVLGSLVLVGLLVITLLLRRDRMESLPTLPEETALEVVSDPSGASVLVDGVLRTGETPMRLHDVVVGKAYRVEVTKKGFRPYATDVRVEKAGLRTVQLALAAAQEAPRPRLAQNPDKRKATTEALMPPASSEPGKLRVVVQPWASVEIDGQRVGDTPFPPRELSAGRHRVVLFNADLNKRVTKTVLVQSGEETVLREDLAKD